MHVDFVEAGFLMDHGVKVIQTTVDDPREFLALVETERLVQIAVTSCGIQIS
jgi:hypothetical protein